METTAVSTPLMRQYSEIKKAHPGALLFFRLGDFYELFFEDAVTAARELEITLTSRNKEKGIAVPMCGVPYHAAENYIARLIGKGYKVAICDQMEDPKQAKKLVRREVTRVLTPGTANFQTAGGENNYLAAVLRQHARVGLAILDLSTGEFRATEFEGEQAQQRLHDELEQWQPREILFPQTASLFAKDGETAILPQALSRLATRTPVEEWTFAPDFARRILENHFGVLSLEGYGLEQRTLAACAAGAIVHYAKETQRNPIAHVDRIGYYERQHGLLIDAVSARNLELVEPLLAGSGAVTLRAVLDGAVTPMGKRLLRSWLLRPSADLGEINARLESVQTFVDNWELRDRLRQTLGGVLDLERLLSRVSLDTAGPRDLLALKLSLDRIPEIKALLHGSPRSERLETLGSSLDDLAELRGNIERSLADEPPATTADGGFIRAGVSPELDELRQLSHNAKTILAQMEQRERSRTGIASLKIRFNNVFGYYIEISKANLASAPTDYERKQTLVNAERFTTPELKELEVKILTAEEKSLEIEQRLFQGLRATAASHTAAIRHNAVAVAEIDLLANFAHQAAAHHYCRPQLQESGDLEVRAGRHPVVERLSLEGVADRFVPNDVYIDPSGQRLLLITGPNMGGKSTYLRQVALLAVMTQMGSFVPAEYARLPIFDRIFTRIGASDNLARGRSTFMVEMTETAAILNSASPRSLIILDEIGRGTATYDGLSLAWAVVEYLHDQVGAAALFATHYHELTALAEHLPGVRNLHVAVKETPAGIVFLRRVEPGEASRSYGIEVAKLAGLPLQVIERARSVLQQHELAAQRTTEVLEKVNEVEGAAGQAAPTASGRPTPRERVDDGGPAMQLTIFTPLSQQIVDRLSGIDLNKLTPLEAMNLLAEIQRQIKEQG